MLKLKNFFIINLILSIIVCYDTHNKIIVEYIEKESIFNYQEDIYKITLDGELHYKNEYIDNELFIEYRVFKNGKEITLYNENNYIYVDCDYAEGGPFNDHFDIEIINKYNNKNNTNENYGWIIYSGGICGNTFSYQTDIIIPPLVNGNKIVSSNQLFATKPNIILNDNNIEIFYCFQEWNFGGTKFSEFIPQKLTYDLRNHKIIDSKIEINDLSYLKFDFNLEYLLDLSKNFTSLFMSGFNDLNFELMQYAIDNLYNSEHVEEWYNFFYGANFEYDLDIEEFNDTNLIHAFIWGILDYYDHNNIKWLYEFYTEEGFSYHEKEVINTDYNYVRLIDCSKKSFQNVVNQLK